MNAKEHAEGITQLRALAERVAAHAAALRALGGDRVARALGGTTQRLADATDPIGRHLRDALPTCSALSPAMVEWAVQTAVAPFSEDVARGLAARIRQHAPPHTRAVPPRLCVVVLAGNVFTASLRAIALPLLAGAPVVAKASSRDDLFPRLFRRALMEVDPEVGPCLEIIQFPGGWADSEDALWSVADVVSVYGGDSTLRDIRARLSPTTRFIGHGHGLGAVYLPRHALSDRASLHRAAEAVALDVAAYDQRGCLSPHAVWVEAGSDPGGEAFARALAEALEALSRTLPRGPLPTEIGAAQVQWRGVAAVRGTLFEGDGYGVSWEGSGSLRLSPGWRNVSVLECADAADLGLRLQPLGVHLKALGVAGDAARRRALAARLPLPLAPRVVPVGQMQTPEPDALADGEHPWAGLIRYIEMSPP